MKKLLWLLLPALAAYGAWDLVREVRGAWTSDYSRTYSRAVGQTMSRAFDSLNLSGRGVRIGVLDAGFGGFRTDRWHGVRSIILRKPTVPKWSLAPRSGS